MDIQSPDEGSAATATAAGVRPSREAFEAPAPAAVLVRLQVLEDPEPGPVVIHGRDVHGWFLRAIQRLDPALSDAVHDKKGERRKPFTTWGGTALLGGERRDDGSAWLRLTVLEPWLTPVVDRLLRENGEIRLGSARFAIEHCTADHDDHPWVAVSSYPAIYEAAAAATEHRIRLRFITPTAFAGDCAPTLFPEGRLVFSSLARNWNAHAPAAYRLPDDTVTRLLDGVHPVAHAIRTTRPVPLRHYAQRGFVGWCEYSLAASSTPDLSRAIATLAAFSFFSGVGLKTTMGMGQVVPESANSRG